MVNFHDPLTIAREFGEYAFAPGRPPGNFPSPFSTAATAATVNLWHTMDGVFMWVSQQYSASGALLDYSIAAFRVQLGILNNPQLWMGCLSGASPLQMDNMGLYSSFGSRQSSIVTGTAHKRKRIDPFLL
jgi:hypothetical protein